MQIQRIIEKIQTILIIRDEKEKIQLQEIMEEVYSISPGMPHKSGTTLTELHIIDCIDRNSPINVSSIASILGITKGGVSKISTRLLKKGWIYKTQLLDNRKEVYFRLTLEGKKVAGIHETHHKNAADDIEKLLQNYDSSELLLLERILDDAIISYSGGK